MIDIHCHILPGIDDGAPDLDTSIAMAAIAAADGIQAVIATPHVGMGGPSRTIINGLVEQLNTALQKRSIALRILAGAEVQSHVAMKIAEQYCLASGSYLLIEFPYAYLPADAVDIVSAFIRRGITPIIAHPERNREIGMDPGKLSPLLEAGARIQITAASLTGELGPNTYACAQFLIKKNMVHFIGTDSHSPGFRKPILSRAVKRAKKYLGQNGARALVLDNPMAILPADTYLNRAFPHCASIR